MFSNELTKRTQKALEQKGYTVKEGTETKNSAQKKDSSAEKSKVNKDAAKPKLNNGAYNSRSVELTGYAKQILEGQKADIQAANSKTDNSAESPFSVELTGYAKQMLESAGNRERKPGAVYSGYIKPSGTSVQNNLYAARGVFPTYENEYTRAIGAEYKKEYDNIARYKSQLAQNKAEIDRMKGQPGYNEYMSEYNSIKSGIEAYERELLRNEYLAKSQAGGKRDELYLAEKYGIDLNTFDMTELDKWAREHNFVKAVDRTTGDFWYEPKRTGAKIGKAGTKLTTRVEEEDIEKLLKIAGINTEIKRGKEHRVKTELSTIVTAPYRGTAGLMAMADSVYRAYKGKDIDQNSDLNQAATSASVARQSIKDNHQFGPELPIIGKTSDFVYDTRFSTGDSVANMLVASVLKISSLGAALTASPAAVEKMLEQKRKGSSDIKAVAAGMMTFGIEFLCEKFGLDEIIKGGKTLPGRLLKAFVSEGGEEAASEILNAAADVILNGRNADLMASIGRYEQEGKSRKDAIIAAWTDVGEQALSAALSGGFSGVAMGAAHEGVTRASKRTVENADNYIIGASLDAKQTKEVIKEGLLSQDEKLRSSALSLAIQRQKNKINTKELGALAAGLAKSKTEYDGKNKIQSDVGIPQNANSVNTGYMQKDDVKYSIRENGRNIYYKINESFDKQVENVINGRHNKRFDLYISETPEYLTKLNFTEGPLLMRNGKVSKILKKHSEMSSEIIKQIPKLLQDPLLVLKSKTHPQQSVVVVSDFQTDKGSLIVPIWVNQQGRYVDVDLGEIELDTNFLASAYGRNIKTLLQYAQENNGFLSRNQNIEKVRQLFARNGLQLPTPLKLSDSEITISQNVNSVNTQYMQNPKKDAQNKHGIIVNNVSAEFGYERPKYYTVLDGVAKRLGVAVVIDEDIDGADGYYDRSANEIHINKNAQNPLFDIIKHETSHVLEERAEYRELIDFMKSSMRSDWDGTQAEIIARYERVNKKRSAAGKNQITLDTSGLELETAAEMSERLCNDKFIEQMTKSDPGIIEKIKNFVSAVQKRLKELFGFSTDWDIAAKKWETAFSASAKASMEISKKDAKYKLQEDIDTNKVSVYNDINEIPYRERRQLEDYILSKNNRGEKLLTYDFKEIGDNFYMWENRSRSEFGAVKSFPIEGNEDIIDYIRSVKNGKETNTGKSEDIDRWISSVRNGGRGYQGSDDLRGKDRNNGQSNRIYDQSSHSNPGRDKGNSIDVRGERIESTRKNKLQDVTDGPATLLDYMDDLEASNKRLEDENKLLKSQIDSGYIHHIEKENTALHEVNDMLRKRMVASAAIKSEPVRINSILQKIKKQYRSKVNLADAAARVQTVIKDVMFGSDEDAQRFESAYAKFLEIGIEIVENSSMADTTMYDTYKDLRNKLRNTPFSISEKDAKSIPDFADFVKREIRGKIRLTKDADMRIDTYYQELLEEYPGVFDATLTHPADQLVEIARVRESLNPKIMDIDVQDAGSVIATQLMHELLTETPLDEQKIIEKMKKGYLEQYKKERGERESRLKLLKLAKECQNMRTTPENLAKIPEIVWQLDTMGISILEKGYTRADGVKVSGRLDLAELKRVYDETINKDDAGNYIDGNRRIEKAIARLDRIQIDNLSIDEVNELITTLTAVKHQIQTENKLISDMENREIYKAAQSVVSEVRAAGGVNVKRQFVSDFATLHLSPMRMVRRMTGYARNSVFVKMTQNLADGQRKKEDFERRTARRFAQFTLYKEDCKKLNSDVIEIPVAVIATETENGETKEVLKQETIKINPAERMALYLHSKDADNLRHIKNGGIVIPDIKALQKGKLSLAYNAGAEGVDAKVCRLSYKEIQKICEGMSDFEKSFADAAYEWLNNDCREAINETSRKLLGYDVARKKNYMPIKTDRDFTKSDPVVVDGSVAGQGFTKERIPGASNPIMLVDIFRVIDGQKRGVGDYYGLAVPIRDFQRVWNTSLNGYSDSVKKAVRNKWGDTGTNYIDDMIRDLSGGRKSDKTYDFVSKIQRKYAGAVLMLNIAVAIKQAASYPTAAAVVGWDPLIKAFSEKMTKADIEKMEEYTPLLWYRSQGYKTTEIADFVSGAETYAQRAPEMFGWIQKIDIATTTKLWKAAEFYVRDNLNLKTGSDEYYNAVKDVYNRIIEETQPNYTVMQMPEALRNKNAALKSVTMFMTQPLQNANILYDATGELNAAWKSGDAKWKREAFGKWGRAMTSQIVSAIIYKAMDRAGKAILRRGKQDKDDEKEKLTLQKAAGIAADDILSGLANNVLFGSRLYEFVSAIAKNSMTSSTWRDLEQPGLAALNDIAQSVQNVTKIMLSDDKKDFREWIKPINLLICKTSTALGYPMENAEKIIKAVYLDALSLAHMLGVNTTGLEYQMLRITTPISKKDAYGDFLSSLITAEMEERDSDKKTQMREEYEAIAEQMREWLDEDYVKNVISKTVKKGKIKVFDTLTATDYTPIRDTISEDVKAEMERLEVYQTKYEYKDSTLTIGDSEYELNEYLQRKLTIKRREYEAEMFDSLLGKGNDISVILYGGTPFSSKDETAIAGLETALQHQKQINFETDSELQAIAEKVKSNERLVPNQCAYIKKKLKWDEIPPEEQEKILEDMEKRNVPVDEGREYIRKLKSGEEVKEYNYYLVKEYSEYPDDVKKKILEKIKTKAKEKACEEMTDEVLEWGKKR